MPNRSIDAGQLRPWRSSNPCLVTWDTAYVTRAERFSYFREGICQKFCAFSPEAPRERDVEGRVERFQVARGVIGRAHTTPMRVHRGRADVATIPDDYLSLVLQLTGGLEGRLGGQPHQEKTGEVRLNSVNEVMDCEIVEDGMYSTISLVFPRTNLEHLVEVDRTLPLSPDCTEPVRRCLILMNERLRDASQAEMTHLFDATLSLLIAGLVRDKDFLEDRSNQEGTVRNGLLLAIQSFIAENIANPHLSTGHVASRFGVSPRYIQKLFAAAGTTFKSYVTGSRLDRVRADLLDVALSHVPTNDIAYRWGFRHLTTFHRNFKSRFDDTPLQMRSFVTSNLLKRLRRQP